MTNAARTSLHDLNYARTNVVRTCVAVSKVTALVKKLSLMCGRDIDILVTLKFSMKLTELFLAKILSLSPPNPRRGLADIL
jgi:hypothetical protein